MTLPAPAAAVPWPDGAVVSVLLVDDEPLARLRLRSLLAGVPGITVTGEAADATHALALLAQQPADVVLLDIAMPGPSGLQFAAGLRGLPAGRRPAVVFVTAHAAHALQAFELEAVDYLTKPVRRERLLRALARVARVAAPAAGADGAIIGGARGRAGTAPGAEPVLHVHDRGRLLRLPLVDVLVLKAELKYVTLHTPTRSHLVEEPLSALEARLGDAYLRIHRNALVRRDAVRELAPVARTVGDGWAVRVAPHDAWFPVSRRLLGAVRAALEARP